MMNSIVTFVSTPIYAAVLFAAFFAVFPPLYSSDISDDHALEHISFHDKEMPEILIGRPWARETSPKARSAAVYLTIRNDGHKDDILIEASSPRAERVMIHNSSVVDGVARMRPVETLTISKEDAVTFEPGGLHIMLVGLDKKLEKGKVFPLTLTFEKTGEVTVYVEVTPVTGPDT